LTVFLATWAFSSIDVGSPNSPELSPSHPYNTP
jgi:hypothetical protein